MAKYTIQLRSVVENGGKIFDFDYPIFDESYRNVLEQKIIDTYYFREIGLETVGQFKHFLKAKLNNIMPLYNEQYLALEVFKTYDPYINKDITVTQTRTATQENTGKANSSTTSESSSNGREIYSDTPQGKLSNLDYATNLTDNDATGTSTDTGETTTKGTITSTDEYIESIKGFDGMKYASEVYQGVRDTIVNIDLDIIDELNDLFMNIY